MTRKNTELYVGIFVAIGCACIAYLVLTIGQARILPSNQYHVHGYFSSVTGLKKGARVELSVVQIGRVADISLDKNRLQAKVEMQINDAIELSEDSIASVKTAGIIGEKFISILPGGDIIMLEDGDEMYHTESTLDIESLVRKFIFSGDED